MLLYLSPSSSTKSLALPRTDLVTSILSKIEMNHNMIKTFKIFKNQIGPYSRPNPLLHPVLKYPTLTLIPLKLLIMYSFTEMKFHFCLDFCPFYFIFIIVVLLQLSQFSPMAFPFPTHSQLPQSIPTLLSMSMGHLYLFLDQTLPLLSPLMHPPPPVWSLSVSSLFPCLWFYFACLFVLFISFHL